MSPWICCACHAGVFRFWDMAVCDWAQKKEERKKIAWFSRSYVFKNIWHLASENLLLQKPFCICLGQSGPIYSRLKSQAWSLEGGCLYTFGQAVYSDLKCCYKYKREDVTPCQTFGNSDTSVEANQFITDLLSKSGMVLQALLVLGTIRTIVSKLISTCLLTVFPSMPRTASPQQYSVDSLLLSIHWPSGQLVPAYKLCCKPIKLWDACFMLKYLFYSDIICIN